ncbi:hypothetical protein ACOSQ3_019819 [Xanthoceras sorbifolium]
MHGWRWAAVHSWRRGCALGLGLCAVGSWGCASEIGAAVRASWALQFDRAGHGYASELGDMMLGLCDWGWCGAMALGAGEL